MRTFNARSCARPHGFTLIEVLISAGLMALILSSAYVCLNAAVSSQRLIEPRIEAMQSARVALALMTADLRCACPLSKEFELLGMHRTLGEAEADNLDFATHNYTPRRPRENDFCEESFFLDKNPTSGEISLWRRRNPRIATDPLTGGRREEIARGVRGLRFEYSDGLEWYDSWGDINGRAKQENSLKVRSNLSGLPEAVRITLWMDSHPKARATAGTGTVTNEPPLVFQTVARLNLAGAKQAGPSTTLGGNETAAPANANNPTPGGTQ